MFKLGDHVYGYAGWTGIVVCELEDAPGMSRVGVKWETGDYQGLTTFPHESTLTHTPENN